MTRRKPKSKRMIIEKLAKLLHESGREAVAKRLVYRDDLPIKPFCEWRKLPEPARDGRRLQAMYLIDNAREVVIELLSYGFAEEE